MTAANGTKQFCDKHIENAERMAAAEIKIETHGEQVEDLYDKHNELVKMMGQMKVCIEAMNGNVTRGFEKQSMVYQQLHDAFQARTDLTNSLLVKYDKIIDGFNQQLATINLKLAELDKFDWFRKRLNKAKEWLPDAVIWLIVVTLVFLLAEHWTNLSAKIGRLLNR